MDYLESRTDTMVTSLKNQLIYDQGCVFRANYATLCGCNHVIRGRVTPCQSRFLTPRALDITEAATMVKAITLVLFSVSVLSLAQGFSLTILHTNDNHARFEEKTSAASYAIQATLKRASVMEEWLAKQR